MNCPYLKGVYIESNVTVIPERAFPCYGELSLLEVPGTLRAIERNAFWGCLKLREVFFDGTKSEFEKIETDEGNEEFYDTGWYFSYKPNGGA